MRHGSDVSERDAASSLGGERGVSPLVLPFLALGEVAYRAAIALWSASYAHGVLRAARAPRPVISVGNLTAGGNGKTPFVILLAGMLARRGVRVAVLSRGYRGQAERRGEVVVVSTGGGPRVGPEVAGDEPVLIAARTEARVVVARERLRAAELAVAELEAELLLLDDGFQHRRLARELDVVLVDAARPFGDGHLLPRGRLREPPSALARAHLVVAVDAASGGVDRVPGPWPGAPQVPPAAVGARVAPSGVLDPAGRSTPPGTLAGRRVALLAAIARPERFEATVRALGATVVLRAFYRDHAPLPGELVASVTAAAQRERADLVLTTEKDWFRLEPTARAGLFALAIALEVTHGAEVLDEALTSILGGPPA